MNSTNCEDTELTLGSDVVKTVLFIVHNCDFFLRLLGWPQCHIKNTNAVFTIII